MKEIRFVLALVGIFILLISCGNDVQPKKRYSIVILDAHDSTELGFCLLQVFRDGECVLDTNANIDGEFSFTESVEKIVLRYAATYPRIIYADDLEKDSVFYMKVSEIMMESGGMGTDEIMNELFEEIEQDVIEWNKINCFAN